jgi:zinc transport system substrate-binding protein
MVSIGPQKYFVEKISGDLAHTSVLVPPGFNPVIYEPKPQQMVELTEAEIYFAIGVPFEKIWLEKFAAVNPRMRIIHTEDGIEKLPMTVNPTHNDGDHDHGHHGTKDPHIWLSPPLVQVQLRTIREAFLQIDPGRKQYYTENYNRFAKEVADLDQQIRELLDKKGEGAQFMVYHPSWGYFAETYGLKQISVEMEGKEPKARDLQKLIQYARKEKVKAVFVQPQFSAKSAQTIAKAIGCRVLYADPLAIDWAENLLNVAARFSSSLE